MKDKYILGVDGGKTKTDLFLFTIDGEFVDFVRKGTCSHEALKDSFVGAKRELGEQVRFLLSRNNLTVEDIYTAVFGLAGCDIPSQHESLCEVVRELGFKKFVISNDSFLGIKALGEVGVCSVCGTGTAAGGIDVNGNMLQVGGIGSICGDEAGGSWLARRAIKETFNYAYRFSKPSYINKIVFEELKIDDKYYLMEAISKRVSSKQVDLTRITKEVFNGANLGDEVCIDLLKEMANNLARSAGGCVVNLDLGEKPLVVMVGSVFVKGSNDTLVNEFKRLINEYTKKDCNCVKLMVPPATGAVIWAYELAKGKYPSEDIKKKRSGEVEKNLQKIDK